MTTTASFEAAACGIRHGLLQHPADIPTTASDLPKIFHASVPREANPTRSAGGGVGRSRQDARVAAVGEAVERYCASRATLPSVPLSELNGVESRPFTSWTLHSEQQRRRPDFPATLGYTDDPWMTETYRLIDNAAVWVPASLVGLTTEFGALATSSGLAAHTTATMALLRACQELIERDAFMATWLHGTTGRRVDVPSLEQEVAHRSGAVAVYDITPAYSPHPVACVIGTMPQGNLARSSLGIACRRTWEEAVDKAFLELMQGILFAGYQLAANPTLAGMRASDVRTFDDHAIYYTANPQHWHQLPIHSTETVAPPPPVEPAGPDAGLYDVVQQLCDHGIELMYRDLTTVDARQLGVRVVRVLSPQLIPIHHDHRWPFLGGTTADLERRYPLASPSQFPSPFPHPLG